MYDSTEEIPGGVMQGAEFNAHIGSMKVLIIQVNTDLFWMDCIFKTNDVLPGLQFGCGRLSGDHRVHGLLYVPT